MTFWTAAATLTLIPSFAIAAPSFTSRAKNAALDGGLSVSGVQLQRKRARQAASRVESCVQIDREDNFSQCAKSRDDSRSESRARRVREDNVPAFWVGLQLRSSGYQYRLQVDAFRLATSVLPGGRSIRTATSAAFAAWNLLEPAVAHSANKILGRHQILLAPYDFTHDHLQNLIRLAHINLSPSPTILQR